ncbi:hypothetical protein PG997_000940 [Apiospora hydei]|uniref:Uncharacterized protein n=1 Tax=Apiospora hydei TaxID=1337664 RepID=A0ABR1XC29_9PEZI
MAAATFDRDSDVPLTPYSPYRDDFDIEHDRRGDTKDLANDPEAGGIGRRTNSPNPLGRFVNALLIIFFCFIGVYGLLKAIQCYNTADTTVTQGPVKGVDWGLDFPLHYPPLAQDGSSDACRAAWDSLSSINCHEKIFTHDWDNATHELVQYLPDLCRPGCRKELVESTQRITKECSAAVFDAKDYNGTFDVNSWGRGPAEALQVLLHRNSYTCRPSEHSRFDYCMEEMIQTWGIYDGENHTSLDGLSSFMATGGGGQNRNCGSCTLDWLENTLNEWKPSQVLSPDTHVPISLPEHLRRVEQAGQTCQKEDWEKMWGDAIRRYTEEGSLSSDWRNMPSGDYGWTVRNGLVSPADGPRPAIHKALESISAKGQPSPQSPMEDAYKCLSALENQVATLPCDIHLSKSQLDSILEPRNPLFDSYCRQECTDEIVRHQDNLASCRSKNMENHAVAGPLYTAYKEAEERRSNICRKPAVEDTSCAPIFVKLHHPEWAFDTRLAISSLEPLLGELERQPIPITTSLIGGKSTPSLSPKSDAPLWDQIAGAHDAIRTGICSRCVWETVVGNGTISSAQHSLEGVDDVDAYLGFADRLYKACTARGADWLGGLPYGGDDAVWRIQDVDGSVSRLIEDESSSPSNRGVWIQAYENTSLVKIRKHIYGSIWHLRAAGRRVKAEKQGNLTQFLAEESKHREEEDAKVWRHGDPKFQSWEWIQPQPEDHQQ